MPVPQDHLGYLVTRVCQAFRGARAGRLSEIDLHCGQDLLLLMVSAEAGLTPSEVAERLAVEPPTVTKMVQRMEKAGRLQKRADPADARAVCLHLTEAGRRLQAEVHACWDDLEAQATAGLTVEERIVLRRLLLHLLANLSGEGGMGRGEEGRAKDEDRRPNA